MFDFTKIYGPLYLSVTHTLPVSNTNIYNTYRIILLKIFKNYVNNVALLIVLKEVLLSKITDQTYFDTKITVVTHG